MTLRLRDIKHLRGVRVQGGGYVAPVEQGKPPKLPAKPKPKRMFATAGCAAWNDPDGAATLIVPMEVVSELNKRGREHFRERISRVRSQRTIIAVMLLKVKLPPLPVKLTMTRIAPRRLDHIENLSASMKAVVDEIAKAYGVDDSDERYSAQFSQAVADGYGVVVRIEGQ